MNHTGYEEWGDKNLIDELAYQAGNLGKCEEESTAKGMATMDSLQVTRAIDKVLSIKQELKNRLQSKASVKNPDFDSMQSI